MYGGQTRAFQWAILYTKTYKSTTWKKLLGGAWPKLYIEDVTSIEMSLFTLRWPFSWLDGGRLSARSSSDSSARLAVVITRRQWHSACVLTRLAGCDVTGRARVAVTTDTPDIPAGPAQLMPCACQTTTCHSSVAPVLPGLSHNMLFSSVLYSSPLLAFI